MAVSASQSSLSGLPRRLVQDGIVSEESHPRGARSISQGQRRSWCPTSYENELAESRGIAVAAVARVRGPPAWISTPSKSRLETLRAVDQKLLNKHQVLPLLKRGQRLFLGISDPTNLQAIDDVKFQTSLQD